MRRHILTIAFTLAGMSNASVATADQNDGMHIMMDHSTHMSAPGVANSEPREGGQSAFSAIQEIVEILLNDPETDWTRIDIEAVRQHLIDMDNVTLRAEVATVDVEGGARFLVSSDDPVVAASITRMVVAHAAVMDGAEGWAMSAETTDNGATLVATGDAERLRALGFIGVMTFGAHHQQHHLALAQGVMPH